MAEKITIHAAKTNLSKLIARAEAGEEIVIYRGDKPAAKLVAAKKTTGAVREGQTPWGSPDAWDGRSPRKPGQLKGVIGPTPDDAFEAMTEEEIAEWENGPVFPTDRK
ncbi:MAG: type II toxin-antitoxin system Phd/YefM family antitoxin [Hyphomonadaceae bacterium]